MSDQSTDMPEDREGKSLDEAAREGTLDARESTSVAGAGANEEGDTYEERDDAEEGRA